MRTRKSHAELESRHYELGDNAMARRLLHTYGESRREGERDFYEDFFYLMGYRVKDRALDVGAGMGDDALNVAELYKPHFVYALEPPGKDIEELETKFLKLVLERERRGLANVTPLVGSAEAIPLPDGTITKLTSVHSIY